jgi:hypothetical protein
VVNVSVSLSLHSTGWGLFSIVVIREFMMQKYTFKQGLQVELIVDFILK